MFQEKQKVCRGTRITTGKNAFAHILFAGTGKPKGIPEIMWLRGNYVLRNLSLLSFSLNENFYAQKAEHRGIGVKITCSNSAHFLFNGI